MQTSAPTHYEKLQIHPAAPLDLITAAYWHLVSATNLQTSNDSRAEAVHGLSAAYAALTDPTTRARYDRSISLLPQPIVPKLNGRKHFLPRLFPWSRSNGSSIDHYEVIRVHPSADPKIVDEGYAAMRTVYLRLVQIGEEPVRLLDVLEESYSVTSDPDLRRKYDAGRNGSSKSRITRPGNGAVAATSAKTYQPPKNQVLPAPPPSTKEPARELQPQPTPVPETAIAPTVSPDVPAASSVANTTAVPRVRPLIRSMLRAATAALAAVVRAIPGVAKAAVLAVAFVPRGVFALGEFFVGLVTALVADPDTAPTGAVRRVLPDEEAALVARISRSTVRAQIEDEDRSLQHEVIAHVVVTGGPEQGATFEVSRWPISIGSALECDIVLPEIAPQQIRLLARGESLVLYGLAENPSLLVNGEPVTWSALSDGDTVSMGAHSIKVER